MGAEKAYHTGSASISKSISIYCLQSKLIFLRQEWSFPSQLPDSLIRHQILSTTGEQLLHFEAYRCSSLQNHPCVCLRDVQKAALEQQEDPCWRLCFGTIAFYTIFRTLFKGKASVFLLIIAAVSLMPTNILSRSGLRSRASVCHLFSKSVILF